MTLDQLSAAATQGEWELRHDDEIWGNEGHGDIQLVTAHSIDAAFICQLVNLYRTGQLVAVADDVIERVARTLAPNLEGGREFDQMPKDRAQLRQWTAQGMCLINDATQDDATWLAQEAIKAAKGTGHE